MNISIGLLLWLFHNSGPNFEVSTSRKYLFGFIYMFCYTWQYRGQTDTRRLRHFVKCHNIMPFYWLWNVHTLYHKIQISRGLKILKKIQGQPELPNGFW